MVKQEKVLQNDTEMRKAKLEYRLLLIFTEKFIILILSFNLYLKRKEATQ